MADLMSSWEIIIVSPRCVCFGLLRLNAVETETALSYTLLKKFANSCEIFLGSSNYPITVHNTRQIRVFPHIIDVVPESARFV